MDVIALSSRTLRCLLAVAFAFLMGGAGVQDTLLLCRMENTLHRTCCCKQKSVAGQVDHDELRRRSCCDEVSWAADAIPPSSALAVMAFIAPALLEHRMPRAVAMLRAPERNVSSRVVDVREATGPPLHIKHHALLI